MKTSIRISLALSAFLMLSCTSNYYQTNKYYGYNNNPEREKTERAANNGQYINEPAQNVAEPVQQNINDENVANSANTEVVDSNSYNSNGNTVVNSVSYVPVIAPWWERDYYTPYHPYYATDYYYPSSCGIYYSYGYYDYWYSPWYSWNPIYGGYFNPYFYSYYPYYRNNYWGGGYYYSGDPGHTVKQTESRHRNFGPNSGYVKSTSASASGTRSGGRTVSGSNSGGRTAQGVKNQSSGVNGATSGSVINNKTARRAGGLQTTNSRYQPNGTVESRYPNAVPNGRNRVVRSSGQTRASQAVGTNRSPYQNTPTRENSVPSRTTTARPEPTPQRSVESAPSRSSEPSQGSSSRESSPSTGSQSRGRR